MSVLLETTKLCAGYGPLQIIKDIDVQVAAGRFTVIVGPNGAGKTTLMRAFPACCRQARGKSPCTAIRPRAGASRSGSRTA